MSAARRFQDGCEALAAHHWERAQACFEAAVSADATLAEAHANLGYVQEQRGQTGAAERSYRTALSLDAAQMETHLNLGCLLWAQRRLSEAQPHLETACALDPDCVSAWSNLGAFHSADGADAAALRCLDRALALDPQHASARFNLGVLLLRQGDWRRGWDLFEAREGHAEWAARLPWPRASAATLAGRRLLVVSEGGHGDVIQFCRFIAQVKAQGAVRVGLVCDAALHRLLTGLAGVDELLTPEAVFASAAAAETPSQAPSLPLSGPWDHWLPLLSLPQVLGMTVTGLAPARPYLRAPDADCARWRAQLPAAAPRVGLVWRGNPRFENDGQRSLPSLAVLAPLAQVAGVAWVSLQKGAGEAEVLAPYTALAPMPLGPAFSDFADTAAVVAQLDLVLTVDTAVAHLAGALGTPCWVLLPAYQPDWRWLQGREDSPWYPDTLSLVRQHARGDWSSTIAGLVPRLQAWVAAFRAKASEPLGRPGDNAA